MDSWMKNGYGGKVRARFVIFFIQPTTYQSESKLQRTCLAEILQADVAESE